MAIFWFVVATKNLHRLLEEINNITPFIQITKNHTFMENEALENSCDCEKTVHSFLRHSIKYYKKIIDIYLERKDRDRNKYLLPSR